MTLLQEHKIRRLLANAEGLAGGDSTARRWAYLSIRRAEMESREVWALTPHWIGGRIRKVFRTLQQAAGASR